MPNDLTAELDALPNSVEQIADLARRAAEQEPHAYELNVGDRHVLVTRLRNDEHIVVNDLEKHLDEPARARGTAVVHTPDDFVSLVNRISNVDATTVWANVNTGSATALINDHTTWDQPGWRDHTAHLVLQEDEDWKRWTGRDNVLTSQAEFSQFVEDVYHTVVDPDAATMLEVSRTMRAATAVKFSQSTRLDNGDIGINYEETTTSKAGEKGQLEVPERVTVRLSPWRGVEPRDMEARLRMRIQDGQLRIGYRIVRPDVFKDEVFDGLVDKIRDGINPIPLYRGETPSPLR
jgi:uncharacterized protein YfdQ (DUF2303 family)